MTQATVRTRCYLGLLAVAGFAVAGAQPPTILARDAWIRAVPGADVAAAYLTVTNAGTQQATITSISTPVAASAMIHETVEDKGLSRMRPHSVLSLAAHQTVRLEPGGLHVMLQGLTRALAAGERVPLVLAVSGSEPVRVMATVRPLNSE